MKYTFQQLIENNAKGFLTFDIYIKLLVYPVAIPLSWVLLNFTSITANQVTLAGLTVGCLGAVCSFFWGLKFLVAGYLIAFILDFADGTLARNGRGGGEQGVFLDVITDRTVLCFAAVMLSAHHVRLGQGLESFLLLLYLLAYLYEDILSYGLRVAKNRSGQLFVEQGVMLPPLTVRNAFFKVNHFIPGRLSSPLFILLIGSVSTNLVVAYGVGLLVLSAEYVRQVQGMLSFKKTMV
ncbi:MAG: CDP-alcohol phosphatidyltransferase family protein [Verrucomicrobia bacterium]|nr:CDP-alcohol phosphatidyltransferase family protein [Verrucomicrobiota bacterium]